MGEVKCGRCDVAGHFAWECSVKVEDTTSRRVLKAALATAEKALAEATEWKDAYAAKVNTLETALAVERQKVDDVEAALAGVEANKGHYQTLLAEERAKREAAEKQWRWLRAAHLLLANDEAFIGQPDSDVFFFTPGVARDGTPALALNMGDTFAYSCADSEPFEYADAEELWGIAKSEGWPGLIRWTQGRRRAREEICDVIPPRFKSMVALDELRAERDAALARVKELEQAIREHSECFTACAQCGHETPNVDDDVCRALTFNRTPDCDKCSHPMNHHESGGVCWSCVGTGRGCLVERTEPVDSHRSNK